LSSPCLSESWQSYVSSRSSPHRILFIIFLALALCSCSGHAQYCLLVRCRAHCFPMGYCTFSSPQPHARSVFDRQPHQVRLAIFTGCDTTSSHHHVHHEKGDEETASSVSNSGPDSTYAQLISIAILEFGVVLHSILIGLTLAVDENFIILFIVLIFHRRSPSPLSFYLRYLPDLQKPLKVSGLVPVSPSSSLAKNIDGFLSLVPSCTASLPQSVLPQVWVSGRRITLEPQPLQPSVVSWMRSALVS
jgi:hypothetical protein